MYKICLPGMCGGYCMNPNTVQTRHRIDDQLIVLLTGIWNTESLTAGQVAWSRQAKVQ